MKNMSLFDLLMYTPVAPTTTVVPATTAMPVAAPVQVYVAPVVTTAAPSAQPALPAQSAPSFIMPNFGIPGSTTGPEMPRGPEKPILFADEPA